MECGSSHKRARAEEASSTAATTTDAGHAARTRFLRELAKYASSDEDDVAIEGRPRRDGAAGRASSSSLSLFDEVAQREGATQSTHGGPHASRRVGGGLLAVMHAQGRGKAHAGAKPSAMTVVDTYTPLSSGGFMDTSAEHGNVHAIKVGDVVCRRVAHTGPAHDAAVVGASACASPTSMTVPQGLHAAGREMADHTRAVLDHFHKASELPAEEQAYGRAVTYSMLKEIGEVTRLDRRTRSLEVCFADGTRAKLSLHEVRPAGFVERALLQRWKTDPQSRPVPVIRGAAAVGSGWWVVPHLLVRITAPDAEVMWRQRVCVVVAVRRRENTIRLMACPDVGDGVAGPSSGCAAEAFVEVIGVDGLAPVVPRRGERGVVVAGEHRGEQVEVRQDVKDAQGMTTEVQVYVARTATTLQVAPSQVCRVWERPSHT